MQISCRLNLMVPAEIVLWLEKNLRVLKLKKTLSQELDQAEDLKSEMIEQKSVFYRPTILSLSDSLAL